MSSIDQSVQNDAPSFWERSLERTNGLYASVAATALIMPQINEAHVDRYSIATEGFQSGSLTGVSMGALLIAVNIVQVVGLGGLINGAVKSLVGSKSSASSDPKEAVSIKAPAKLMEQSLELAQGLTNDPAKLERMLENCRNLVSNSREGTGVYFVHDPDNPDDQAVLSAEQFADFKRRVDATDKPFTSMTWENKGDVDIQTKMITVGGKRDSSLIGNLPAVQKFEWKEGAEPGRLTSQGWFKDNRMVMPIELVAGSNLKEDMSKDMGELPPSAVFRKENFAHATGVLVERLPEGSPVHEAGLTHRVFAGEQGGSFIELGFATDAEVSTLKKALEPTGIFLNEPGKPTMQRGEPLTEEREKTLGLGL